MIAREISAELRQLLGEYPVVTLLGPRQAGKTTLAQMTLPGFDYVNLELPDVRQFATDDPKGFLADLTTPVILDEIQRAPLLLSYIQAHVDRDGRNGQYVLTGSYQLQLHEAITQSLAGRTAVLTLYPLSISELTSAGTVFDSAFDWIIQGFLPRIYDKKQRATIAYGNYYQTYVERDVRQLIKLKDLSLFDKFMRLLAGRAGQLMDYSSLANDVGVSDKTVKEWLSVLQASFLIYRLPPYHTNFGKRVIKAPKYYFTDTGLLAYLLGLETSDHVRRDPLVGQLFENLVVIECLKALANQGKRSQLYFYRDSNGNEVDILFDRGRELVPIEVKASSTYSARLMKGLKRIRSLTDNIREGYLVYNGDPMTFSDGTRALRFDQVSVLFER